MNKLRILKSMRTKWLNRSCKSEKEFEEVQNKLNEIDILIKLEKLGKK